MLLDIPLTLMKALDPRNQPREMAGILDTAFLQALLLTGQSAAAIDLPKGFNYCDLNICEEILQKGNQDVCLLELYKYNSMYCEALKLLHQLVEDATSAEPKLAHPQKFKPKMIIEYLKTGLILT